MKTLTSLQIKEIENLLTTKYHIKYQDTRDEILDHIACEIEDLINEGLEYENALDNTLHKWHNKLLHNYFGAYKGLPYFISDKLSKDYFKIEWKIVLISMVLSVATDLALRSSNISTLYFFIIAQAFIGGLTVINYFSTRGESSYYLDFFNRCITLMILLSLFSIVLYIGISWIFSADDMSISYVLMYQIMFNCYFLFQFRKFRSHHKPTFV